MTFLNFSQLPESVFRPNFSRKHFPGNQAKFFFDWKVFSVDQLSQWQTNTRKFGKWFPGKWIPGNKHSLKETLNGLVQNIWSKMNLKDLGTSKYHEGQPLIHLLQIQEEPNLCGTRGWCVRPHPSLVRLVFPNDTRIKS